MSSLILTVDRLAHDSEAGVSELDRIHIGIKRLHYGAINRVVDGVVVGDDSLPLERIYETLNLRILSYGSVHDSHDSICETYCGRNSIRVALDLNLLSSGSIRKGVNLLNESTILVSQNSIKAVDSAIVRHKLHHELHLLQLHSRKSVLKISDVWDDAEVVLEL